MYRITFIVRKQIYITIFLSTFKVNYELAGLMNMLMQKPKVELSESTLTVPTFGTTFFMGSIFCSYFLNLAKVNGISALFPQPI